MTGFGTGRDVCREALEVNTDAADVKPLPEETLRATHGIVRYQAGTNRYESQKGMTGMGTARRELTKMKDSKHPEYIADVSIDQSTNPLQSGTNKFASQRGMTGFGTNRRETTKMVDNAHPDQVIDHPDQSTIPSQMGSNKFASQQGMTGFGQPRWEALHPQLSQCNRNSHGIVRAQAGSNQFASQQGMTGFGMPRDVPLHAEGADLAFEDIKQSETIIPAQAGWNKGDSQKKMTGFGAPRDVKGKHIKRLWELEFPEEVDVQGFKL
jgi:hypothetical protein